MIKAVALDVDGVILGTLQGINSPYPSESIIKYLQGLRGEGIPISLISGKGSFAMRPIIEKLGLDNLHVTDAGAIVLDPINKSIASQKLVSKEIIREMILDSDYSNLLWELYDTENWHVQKGVKVEELEIHRESSVVFQPIKHDSILNVIDDKNIAGFTKAMILYSADQVEEMKMLDSKYNDKVSIQWAGAPAIEPNKMLFITNKEASKKTGIKLLAQNLGVQTNEILGVGDTVMDWEFLEECGYIGVMGNATQELVEKVKLFDQSRVFRGGAVDEDGLIGILEHFKKDMIKQ